MSETAVLKKRIWELDFLKGIALVFMVWDHIVYDLYGFFGLDLSGLGFFKEGIGFISAIIFMTTCGISLTLGKHNIKHGIIVFGVAMGLTAFTFVFDKITNSDSIILFGILHLLGLSMLIGHFAKKLPVFVLAVFSVIIFTLGIYFSGLTVSSKILFPFGLTYFGFYSSDYHPLFPNLAYIFFGIIIGKTIYKEKKSLFGFEPKKSLMCFLGRHTLVFYLAHQPLLMGIIFIVVKIFT